MFAATYFTYGGVSSLKYGVQIATLDGGNPVESVPIAPSNLKLVKPSNLDRFFHLGTETTEPPQYRFSILSQTMIPDFLKEEILSWLVDRGDFKRLKIHQADLEDYYYNCVFTNPEIIYINNGCYGFTFTVQFDSKYAYGKPRVWNDELHGETKNVALRCDSSVLDGYIYPLVIFQPDSVEANDKLIIINKSDSLTRQFEYSCEDLSTGEKITIDNELGIISSDSSSGNKIEAFNKKWLRLVEGVNELEITFSGSISIISPSYLLIGF